MRPLRAECWELSNQRGSVLQVESCVPRFSVKDVALSFRIPNRSARKRSKIAEVHVQQNTRSINYCKNCILSTVRRLEEKEILAEF